MPARFSHPTRDSLVRLVRGGMSTLLCAAFLGSVLLAESVHIGEAAPEFVSNDQYGQVFRLTAHRSRPVLLICGDRLGSDYMGVWARAVRQSAEADTVEVVRVANLHAVPPYFHTFVIHQFQGKNSDGTASSPVLLDWDGVLAKTLGFTDDLTNVYLIDTRGWLSYRASGKGTSDETQKLVAAIGTLHGNQQLTKEVKP
jgi:hypothetical protein